MHRRSFMNKLVSFAVASVAVFLNWKPASAAWLASHFGKGEFDLRFRDVFADRTIIDSDAITIDVPAIAENGAVVPITISSTLKQIGRIYIWVEKNPTPLAAEFVLDESMAVYLTARIKMAESCNVVVVAEQGQQLLRKQQWVKVMQGGCGTG